MAVIEHLPSGGTAIGSHGRHVAVERGARADLRAQIERLEREIAAVAAATYPRLRLGPVTPAMSGHPHVLGLGELELVRDALAERLSVMRQAALLQAAAQAEARVELERMLADPPAHRGRRITNAEIGLPGCKTYEVAPRYGILGRLAGWWEVKVSSGCPLGWGP
jgi:hypothetical protein